MFSFIKKKIKKYKLKNQIKNREKEQIKMNERVKNQVKQCGDNIMVFGEPELIFPDKIILGDSCKLNYMAYLNARSGITIGDDVTVSRGVKIISTGYDLDKFFQTGERVHFYNKPIVIGNHCWICADAIILPGVNITGEYVVVAAGAVVTKDINESRVIVAGNPAKIVKRMEKH